MSTWHQDRNPPIAFHETKWTVDEDPPGDLRSFTVFPANAEAEARAYAETLNAERYRPKYGRDCAHVRKPGPGGRKD